jgi:hypothetical protein
LKAFSDRSELWNAPARDWISAVDVKFGNKS